MEGVVDYIAYTALAFVVAVFAYYAARLFFAFSYYFFLMTRGYTYILVDADVLTHEKGAELYKNVLSTYDARTYGELRRTRMGVALWTPGRDGTLDEALARLQFKTRIKNLLHVDKVEECPVLLHTCRRLIVLCSENTWSQAGGLYDNSGARRHKNDPWIWHIAIDNNTYANQWTVERDIEWIIKQE